MTDSRTLLVKYTKQCINYATQKCGHKTFDEAMVLYNVYIGTKAIQTHLQAIEFHNRTIVVIYRQLN